MTRTTVCGLLSAAAFFLTGCPTQPSDRKVDVDLAVAADLLLVPEPDLARSDLAPPKPDLLAATLTVTWAPQAATASQDGEDFVLSAVVDYSGPGAIYSVELVEIAPYGDALSYGQMQLTDDGVYTRTVSWAELQDKKTLEFATSGTRTLYVAAAAGEAGAISVGRMITLGCTGGGSACAGECGSCGEPTGCTSQVSAGASCSTICADAGKSCSPCLGGFKLISYSGLSCADPDDGTHFGNTCDSPLHTTGYVQYGGRAIDCCCK